MARTLFESDLSCTECGTFGAYAFDGEALCIGCYQARGSCCAERDCGDGTEAPAVDDVGLVSREKATAGCQGRPEVGPYPPGDMLRVNPNCCYQACPRCSHLRKLREFRARFPDDWQSRLRGLPRIVGLARQSG